MTLAIEEIHLVRLLLLGLSLWESSLELFQQLAGLTAKWTSPAAKRLSKVQQVQMVSLQVTTSMRMETAQILLRKNTLESMG